MTKTETAGGTRKKGLTRKLVLSMLLVGALPLMIGLLLAFYQGTQEIREVNGSSFEALATETARKLDLVVAEEISRTALLATDVQVIEQLENRRDTLSELPPQSLLELLTQEQRAWEAKDSALKDSIIDGPLADILQQHMGGTFIDPGHPVPVITRSATRGLYITDIAGRLVAGLDADLPYLHQEEPWWKGAFHNGVGQPYIGTVEFDDHHKTYTFTLALPIMDSLRYEAIGVLRRTYEAKEFFAPSIDIIRFGETGHVMLIDSRGVVLSCPILPTGTTLSDPRLIPLVTPMQAGWTPAPSDGHGGTEPSIIGFAPLTNASQIMKMSTGLSWHMFVWQSSSELFGPIEHFFKWTAAFGLLGVSLLVSLGYWAANRITAPIRRLQEAARQIGRGEFRETIVVPTGDELEELAEEINRMNQQLASQFAGLESQVQLKTEEVKYLEESTAKILDSVPDPVIMIGPEERIEYINKAFKETLALNNGEVIGTPLFQIFSLDPSTQTRLKREIQNIQASEPVSSPLPHPLTTASLQDPLIPENWERIEAVRQELRFNQRTYRYRWFGVPARPGKGPSAGLVLRDTTEESLLQDRVIQGEKLASLGVLSAGIGHELNNPLVGVIGLGEAIQEETDTTQIKEYAKAIVQHGKRMASIVRDFTGQVGKQFSEKDQTSVNINEILENSLATVKALFSEVPVDIQTHFGPLPAIQGKTFELGQAFTNILTNSFQAMKQGGKLDISTASSDNTLEIRITDTGVGISPTHLPKVFDPFFTTKGQGEGSGLGLTVAYRTISKLGGHIRMESEQHHGTTCLITLPVTQASQLNERSSRT